MYIPTDSNLLNVSTPKIPDGYVRDGLVVWIDMIAEGDGTKTLVTDLVSGQKYNCIRSGYNAPICKDGILKDTVRIIKPDYIPSTNYSCEMVLADISEGRQCSSAFAVNHYEDKQYNGNYFNCGLEGHNLLTPTHNTVTSSYSHLIRTIDSSLYNKIKTLYFYKNIQYVNNITNLTYLKR